MAYKPTRMDKIEKVLALRKDGKGIKQISRTLGMSKNTVKKYLRRHEKYMASVPEYERACREREKVLLGRVSSADAERESQFCSRLPFFCKELKRVGVTRYLLWEEYIQAHPDGYSYSRFCARIKSYKASQDVTLRLEHKNGYALTIDYAGKKLSYINKATGEVISCEVLVCTLPASGYTYAIALPSQRQDDFVHGINQALLYIKGLPKVLLSDNLKSFVIKADRYEPTFNELSLQLASHYGVELQATRAGKPKDKAHVERHVSIVYNRIYGPLRDEDYYSIEELNRAIAERLEILNNANYQGRSYSRTDLFEEEAKELAPLPQELFVSKKSTRGKVQRNYHIILGEDKHQYSVPHQHVGKYTEIVYTRVHVEIYIDQVRIATHKRDYRQYGYSTLPIHMPERHRHYVEQKGWDAAYFKREAEKIGPNTLWAVSSILESKSLIEQTYNACLGVLGLAKKYSGTRLEEACTRAQLTHRINYQILSNILRNGMDKVQPSSQATLFRIEDHDNIRGASHYQ